VETLKYRRLPAIYIAMVSVQLTTLQQVLHQTVSLRFSGGMQGDSQMEMVEEISK
jgi:hypothetical protein